MSWNDAIEWFEQNMDAKIADLPKEMAALFRYGRTRELSVDVGFIVRFYCLHLKKNNKPLPKGPSDYDMNFVDKASDFFDYVGDRCVYTLLKEQEIVTYEDPNVSLLDSDINFALKAENTEKGNMLAEEYKKKLQEFLEKQKQLVQEQGEQPKS